MSLLCKRRVQDFDRAKTVKFVSFTGALTYAYVVRPVKETCETVHSISKVTCQKVTWFDEPYKTACFWGVNKTSKDWNVYDLGLCKFVEYFHVFPTSYDQLFRIVPSGKIGTRRREHRVNWFP